MSRSTRFFEIIQILRAAKAPVTADHLAERLEVTPRTIYRDMASLQAMRLPILGEAGIGYVLRAGFDLPPLMFDRDEVEAIAVGLALLGRTGDKGLQRAAASAAGKIADVLPAEIGTAVPHRVSTWTRVAESGVDPAALRGLIRDESEVRIAYIDANGVRTERAIRPLALIYYIDVVVLAAWCRLRDGFRHFRVDRIETCEPTGATFREDGAALRAVWEREHGFALP
jgi:predicted DNA-binding transcriptional regulator YafY